MIEHAKAPSLALTLRLDAVATAGLGFVLAAAPAAADGGFFPESWSWVALATLFPATLLLIVRPRTSLRALDCMLLGGLTLFGIWVAISATWSTTVTGAVEDSWRMLAYVGAVGLTLLVVERRTVPHLLGGTLAGVVAIGGYALLTRLLPDRLGDFESLTKLRLADPIGYWNGLGVYCAMGTLLALGFAARASSILGRALAAAVPVVLLTAMYLTFSRGAWLALATGLVAGIALDPRRLQLIVTGLVLTPWAALALFAASRADALSVEGSSLAAATDDGHALLVWVAVLALAAGLTGAVLAFTERHVVIGQSLRTAFAAGLVVIALGGAAWVTVAHGTPWRLAEKGWNQFRAEPKTTEDLSDRLFDLSSNGRTELWSVSWHDFTMHPVAGRGASSFEQSYYERRESTGTVRDGHSLYAETLGELGVVGLGLLVIALLAPLVAAVRARHRRLVPGAAAAFVAYLVHAAVDWDWELAGVTLVALLTGCGLVAVARPRAGVPRELPRPRGVVAPVAAAALAALALWSLLSTVPSGHARAALERGDFQEAESEARDAERWAPWSSRSWRLLGEAQLYQGKIPAARRSFRRAVERGPGEWLPWLELAITSTGAEQRKALDHAAALNPKDAQIEDLRKSL